jgi:5-formyltetrahydrofolate cyclo-ligase
MKKALRKDIIKQRSLLTIEEVTSKSDCIMQTIIASEWYKSASVIMLYMDYKNEVKTESIIKAALNDGKRVLLPVVDFKEHILILVEIHSLTTDMILSQYGILEPILKKENIRSIKEVDLILSPGVAFDLKGYRLGYGGGFYDKLLATADRSKLTVLALAFDLQVVGEVPVEAFDKRIDGLITESGINYF